jgi:hypothetical protein
MMPAQNEFTFVYESPEKALDAAVAAMGGPKVVGQRLWPSKVSSRQSGDLTDSLNVNNSRKLEIDEVLQILRWAGDAGFHSAKHYFDQACGYQPSVPVEPKVEQARLLRDMTEKIAALQCDLARALDALAINEKLPSPLRRV